MKDQTSNPPDQNVTQSQPQNLLEPSLLPREPKGNRKGLYILLILLFFVLFATAVVAFQLIKKEPSQTFSPPPPPTTNTSQPTETSDEFSDWETYRNKEYGFSFKLSLQGHPAARPQGIASWIIRHRRSTWKRRRILSYNVSLANNYIIWRRGLIVLSSNERRWGHRYYC